jgi:transposase
VRPRLWLLEKFNVFLSPAERAQLEHWQRSTTMQAGLAKRAKIILVRTEGQSLSEIARRLELGRRMVRTWVQPFLTSAWRGWPTSLAGGASPYFPPEVAVHVVKMACERPDHLGRSLSQGDGLELARPVEHQGIVEPISAETVRRLLAQHQRKPWRHHRGLSPTTPRDAEFDSRVAAGVTLYTRPLCDDELVLSVDEKASLQPRPR